MSAPARPAVPVAQPMPTPPAAPVDPNIYSYPAQGQTAEQQGRDRYECHMWAVRQSAFDPSAANLSVVHRVQIVESPAPGVQTVVGAAAGALIGASVSGHRAGASGAVVGAVLGGLLGASAEAADSTSARRAEKDIDTQEEQERAQIEQRVAGYRRSATACLEGRGYTVR
ncbi:MAG: glycine zipper 2TM domain-containing protein [Gammaproteobacteria bacterium]